MPCVRADPPQIGEIASRRHDDAGFALDRLDENGGGVFADRRFDRRGIAERHGDEARREGAEAAPIGGLAGEADDGRRSAMEIIFGDDDLGLVFRNSQPVIAIAPRGLDRRLDGFRARIHRQAGVEPGEPCEILAESAEIIRVIGARDEIEPAELTLQGRDEARMEMAEARGRIGAHHVEIALAIDIVEMNALPMRQHDGQGRIILGAEFWFRAR